MNKEKIIDLKNILYTDEEYIDVTNEIINVKEQNRINKLLNCFKKFILTNKGRLFSLLINQNDEIISIKECVFNIRPIQNPPRPTCNFIISYDRYSTANIDVYFDQSKYINIRKLVYNTFSNHKLDRRTEVLYNIDGNPLNNNIDNIKAILIKNINFNPTFKYTQNILNNKRMI